MTTSKAYARIVWFTLANMAVVAVAQYAIHKAGIR